jgi:competence ComEA-like helix-hairpin-helix protein
MALDDRDYMRRAHRQRVTDYVPPIPRKPWWEKVSWRAVASGIVVLAGIVSATAWLLRDATDVVDFVTEAVGPAEGSLVVNVNTATADELETLPGIGPALATLIIAGRPYSRVDDLEKVRGIGPGTLESLRPLVVVEGETRKR